LPQARTKIRPQASSEPTVEAPETERAQNHTVFFMSFSDELQRNVPVGIA
jgi:hypothetical protein